MYYNRKKELIKSATIIAIILLLAVVSTYYIYNKFKDERNVDYNSKSLDIVFHETSGEKVTITKVTPLTDSVGLSSKAYTLSIKNNLTEPVKYEIKLIDDLEQINQEGCTSYLIPKESIRVSIKKNNNDNKIYTLSELEDNSLLEEKIKALDEEKITIRVWVSKDSAIPNGSTLHYHGKIQVIENDESLAIR